jgi:hypothetical protein
MTENYSAFAPQMRMIDLLQENRAFKEFFRTKPKVPTHLRGNECWRVYVQMKAGGPWAKRDYTSYPEAANFALRLVKKGAWDLTVHSRAISFAPPGRWVNLTKRGAPVYLTQNGKPVLRDGKKVRKQKFVPMHMPPGHIWCPHCRRPTVFRWFRKHHAFIQDPEAEFKVVYDPAHLRCTICGIRESSVNWRGGSK